MTHTQNHSLVTNGDLDINYLHRFLNQYMLASVVIYLSEVRIVQEKSRLLQEREQIAFGNSWDTKVVKEKRG